MVERRALYRKRNAKKGGDGADGRREPAKWGLIALFGFLVLGSVLAQIVLSITSRGSPA